MKPLEAEPLASGMYREVEGSSLVKSRIWFKKTEVHRR